MIYLCQDLQEELLEVAEEVGDGRAEGSSTTGDGGQAAVSLDASPSIPAVGTVLLYFSRYWAVRLKIFSLYFVVFFYDYLCEKYYKSITVLYR